MQLYLFRLREYADKDTLKKIDKALQPPRGWRDPDTKLPAGWSDNEDDEWAMFERAVSG